MTENTYSSKVDPITLSDLLPVICIRIGKRNSFYIRASNVNYCDELSVITHRKWSEDPGTSTSRDPYVR